MIDISTLTDGGQSPASVAEPLGSFLSAARTSLDVAIYDFALSAGVEGPVLGAIRDAAQRGVAVRVAYNVDRPNRVPVPPPPRTDPAQLAAWGVPTKGILGVPHLMHHKFVVRDGAAVWTGSANWTDDSWSREENVLVRLEQPEIASAYRRVFDEIWTRESVEGSGAFDAPEIGSGAAQVRPWFSPGRGPSLAHRIARAIAGARRRVRVASPVITSGPILATLAEVAAARRVEVSGVFDDTQMNEVIHQWHTSPAGSWKIPCFASIRQHAPFSGKRSTPFAPGAVHDYMHAKMTVTDDITFVGSYNLSHAGEENAENVLEIRDAALAERMASFIDEIRLRYNRSDTAAEIGRSP